MKEQEKISSFVPNSVPFSLLFVARKQNQTCQSSFRGDKERS